MTEIHVVADLDQAVSAERPLAIPSFVPLFKSDVLSIHS